MCVIWGVLLCLPFVHQAFRVVYEIYMERLVCNVHQTCYACSCHCIERIIYIVAKTDVAERIHGLDPQPEDDVYFFLTLIFVPGIPWSQFFDAPQLFKKLQICCQF